MAIEPTDGEQVKGTLRLELGGVAKRVAILPIRAADAWIEHLQATIATTAATASASVTAAGDAAVGAVLIELARKTTHAAVDLIVAYDREGTLGDRDWILDNARPQEVSDALDVLRSSALPFGLGILAMVDVFRLAAEEESQRRSAESSSPPSNTNGHSPTGALPLDHLRPRSRTPSSTSSGKRVRNA